MFESCLRNSEKLKPKGLGFFRYCFGKPLHMLQVAVLSPLRYESVPKGPSASPASATQRSSSQMAWASFIMLWGNRLMTSEWTKHSRIYNTRQLYATRSYAL